MRTGELASHAGVDVQTVRYYEREGLLEAPPRTPTGYRLYGPEHLERLHFVRHCRSLDIPVADIKRLLALGSDRRVSCDEVNVLVERHLEHVRAKRAGLERLEAKLGALRARCSTGHQVADCGILEELVRAARADTGVDHPTPAGCERS